MQIRYMGNNVMIRAERGSCLVKKDGTEILKKEGYPADYKITTLVIPVANIGLYDEKKINDAEDEE